MPDIRHPTDSLLTPECDGNQFSLNREQCRDIGEKLSERYKTARPFPSIVLEKFLSDSILSRVWDEFPKPMEGRFENSQSRLKTGYQLDRIDSPFINGLICSLNSANFLVFLEKMTGIKGLIPDPLQLGGGLHETRRGGHLSIHADFNIHPHLKLSRRLNLILFLNPKWESSWGGQLELWERDMSACVLKVEPKIGNAVVFNTDADSFHGHPDPLMCPDNVTRRSLALYYYTALPADADLQQSRTTDFRVRPGSKDKRDYKTSVRHLVRDLCPPILYRRLYR
jgi:Rps23 Pro-64 3,4-dihydroxylase Tpa1-like proline 4-hydroxylase